MLIRYQAHLFVKRQILNLNRKQTICICKRENMNKRPLEITFDQEQITSFMEQLNKNGVKISTQREKKDLEEILRDEELRALLKLSLDRQDTVKQAEAFDAAEKYMKSVGQTFQQIEKLCDSSKEFKNGIVEREIGQLEKEERNIELQKVFGKGLLENRVEALKEDIRNIKEMQNNLKKENNEARDYRKEYLKEMRFQFDRFRDQVAVFINQNSEALNPKSSSDFSVRIGVLSEYLKKEKEWLALCLENNEKLREEFTKSNKAAKPSKGYPELMGLKERLTNDEKEKLLLGLALDKYEFAVKYMKDYVYSDGVVKFDINSYKKISEEEYNGIIKELNNQIKNMIGDVVKAYSQKFHKEIDDAIKRTDDKYHIKQLYIQKLTDMEEQLKAQNERLSDTKKVILAEQDLVQKEYDDTFEQFEYLKQCLEQFESLNEALNDIFEREVNKTSVSVRDEYLYELYKLMKECVSMIDSYQRSRKGNLKDDEDLVILREDLLNLLQSFKQKEMELDEELQEASENLHESLKEICSSGEEALNILMNHDEQEVLGRERQNLQKIWDDNMEVVKKRRAELDLYLNKAFQRFQNIQKRRVVDPTTGISEKDLFVQYVLDKHPKFVKRLKEFE